MSNHLLPSHESSSCPRTLAALCTDRGRPPEVEVGLPQALLPSRSPTGSGSSRRLSVSSVPCHPQIVTRSSRQRRQRPALPLPSSSRQQRRARTWMPRLVISRSSFDCVPLEAFHMDKGYIVHFMIAVIQASAILVAAIRCTCAFNNKAGVGKSSALAIARADIRRTPSSVVICRTIFSELYLSAIKREKQVT